MGNLIRQRMFVQLATSLDLSRFYQLSINAQMEELSTPDGNVYCEVSSLQEASALCRAVIEKFSLGSSRWVGGKIVNEHFDFVAMVSYNGRVWDHQDWKQAKEIEIC